MNENYLILLGLGSEAKSEGKSLAEQIDAVLPQTQCTQCDFDGCKPYSEAIVSGEAEINQCPPGGQDGVDALADFGLTGATVKAGAYIVVPSGDAITAITMSSGSVIIYNQ